MIAHTQQSINSNGIAQIADFLKVNHKKGEMISQDKNMLLAWAQEAEYQLEEGNPATIEIRSFDSVHGRTQEFTVSPEGIDAEKIETEE